MRALSIKQPWAWLICMGYKDIENRGWYRHMPPLLSWKGYAKNVPMRIYVHTGLSKTEMVKETIAFVLRRLDTRQAAQFMLHCQIQSGVPPLFAFGAIIGEVTITGCVDKSDSPWFVGRYGFTLADPILYDKPIPYRGQLGFFEVDLKERTA